MGLQVYDFRTDVRHLDITPEIRSRIMRFEPGTVTTGHTHDLGHEVFIVLSGQAEFEIDGEFAILGPGQYCIALANQMHQVRVIGDEPMTLYLSVTPHVEPTHTYWDENGSRLPPRYHGAGLAERAARDPSASVDVPELANRHLAAVRDLARMTADSVAAHEREVANLRAALEAKDSVAAKAAIDAMSAHVYQSFKAIYAMGDVWNELAPRTAS